MSPEGFLQVLHSLGLSAVPHKCCREIFGNFHARQFCRRLTANRAYSSEENLPSICGERCRHLKMSFWGIKDQTC